MHIQYCSMCVIAIISTAGVDFNIPRVKGDQLLNITIPANTTRVPIEIEIVDDSVLETSETFRLSVKVPQESARLGLAEGAIPSTRVTINNDDSECYKLHLTVIAVLLSV